MTENQKAEVEMKLDDLILALQNYEQGQGKEEIVRYALEIDNSIGYGQKQHIKDELIKGLGYVVPAGKVHGSLNTIAENIMYLTNLGVKNIGKVIERQPPVLEYNIEGYMQDRVDWLEEIGVKNIGKVVERHPQVLAYNIRRGKKIDGKMFDKYAYITGKSLVDPNPKETPFDIANIEAFPASFSYSFSSRIVPRFEYIRTKQGSLDGWNLSKILAPSDEAFVRRLKRLGFETDIGEYAKFKAKVAEEAERYLVEA